MLISNTHKFIFIKTRKVGGTSLEKYIIDHHFDPKIDQCTGSNVDNIPWYNLPTGTRGHIGWNEIIKLGDFENYRVFTLERNPWDKCVSQYFFFRDKINKIPKDMSFSEFLRFPEHLPVDSPRYNTAPVTILKWEEMERDLPMIFAFYGIVFDIDKFKGYNLKSGMRKDEHYSHMYTDEDVNIVTDAFQWECEKLKYDFEDYR